MRLNLKQLMLIVIVMIVFAFAFGFERTSESQLLSIEEYNAKLPPEKRIERSEAFNDYEKIIYTTYSGTLSPIDMARGALIGGIAARVLVYVLQKKRQRKADLGS